MAIYHFSAKVISRAKGSSAVAAAAYRSASRLHDERLDRAHDFTAKAADAEIAGFMRAVGHVTRQLELDGPGYRLMVNMGTSGHQEVPHLHVHIFGGRQFFHMICD